MDVNPSCSMRASFDAGDSSASMRGAFDLSSLCMASMMSRPRMGCGGGARFLRLPAPPPGASSPPSTPASSIFAARLALFRSNAASSRLFFAASNSAAFFMSSWTRLKVTRKSATS